MTAETDVRAALAGHDLAALGKLTDKGVDLNAAIGTDAGPRSPLEQALWLGDTGLVEGLLALPGVNAVASLPADRFWAWAGAAPLPVLRAFLARSGVPGDHRDAAGRTALHAVAAGGADPATVRFLLERVPADQAAEDGTTPFFRAAAGGHAEAAGLLRAAGADPNAAAKENGWTALITRAAAGGDLRWLLDTAGLDVNRAGGEGTTALHVAAVGAARPALDQLLADPRTDRTVRDSWGLTPLMLAAQQADAGTATLLLAGDGHTGENLVDVDGSTALHHAVAAAATEVVQALLARPALNLAITDQAGRTAAQLAQETGQAALVTLLAGAADRRGRQQDRPEAAPPPRPAEPELLDPRYDPSIVEPVQLRRLPLWFEIAKLVAPEATDSARHLEGLRRAVVRARASLSDADQQVVLKEVARTTERGPVTEVGKLRLEVLALQAQRPDLALGDLALIGCQARPGTRDAPNLTRLVYAAGLVIDRILAGVRDADLADVFGAGNVPAAKSSYHAARVRMRQLLRQRRIVTDRSGYSAEVGFTGASMPYQIWLTDIVIDHPEHPLAVLQLIHEALHAGNPARGAVRAVGDHGYPQDPSFTTLSEDVKLHNASHYEVVPSRMMNLPNAFAGQTFLPAGAAGAPQETPVQQVRREVSERVRRAWTAGINLHNLWVQVYRDPTVWFTADPSTSYRGVSSSLPDSLRYWSAVEGLTVHRRPGDNHAAASPSNAPVTLLDVALSEGLLRLLNLTRAEAAARLKTNDTMGALLAEFATPEERTESKGRGVLFLTELVILCLRRKLGRMTGSEARDVRMISALADACPVADWTQIFTRRRPEDFPDD